MADGLKKQRYSSAAQLFCFFNGASRHTILHSPAQLRQLMLPVRVWGWSGKTSRLFRTEAGFWSLWPLLAKTECTGWQAALGYFSANCFNVNEKSGKRKELNKYYFYFPHFSVSWWTRLELDQPLLWLKSEMSGSIKILHWDVHEWSRFW